MSSATFAQPVVWNNALIHVNDTALIHVNGNLEVNGTSGIVENDGRIHARNSVQQADFWLTNNGSSSGNGEYRVQGDWINDASFTADSSRVVLDGANQLITGAIETEYHILELDSSGTKTQTLDSRVNEKLILHDRELHTDVHTMTVLHTDTGAVENDLGYGNEGFVSSISPGGLVRHMDTVLTYRFPLGDSLPIHRYRELWVRPVNNAYHVYRAGLRNFDATNDGWDVSQHDSTLCSVNDQFWHEVHRDSGTADADITLSFYKPADGFFTTNAHWKTGQVQWTDIGNDQVQSPLYHTITSNGHNDFSHHAFALALITPEAPVIVGDSIICDSSVYYTYSSPYYPNTYYDWSFPAEAYYTGQGSSQIDINWVDTQGGTLSLQITDSLGCLSYPANMGVYISTLNASFDTLSLAGAGEFDFINMSQGATAGYDWDMGDGWTYADVDVNHSYPEPGLYEVVLTAYDTLGCVDTALLNLEVLPDIFIPNVITTNNDGVNDVFQVETIGIDENEVHIYNRWGDEVYYSTEMGFNWDGTNYWNGEQLNEGTYYYTYVARAGSISSEYIRKGFVTLIRP